KIAGKHNSHRIVGVENLLADARASGPTIANMYPYAAGSTMGTAIFPPEVRRGSRAEFIARLGDDNVRARIYEKVRGDRTSWDNFVGFCGGLSGIQVAGVHNRADDHFLGQRLDAVAAAAQASDPGSREAMDAVIDFFVRNQLDVTIISHFGEAPIVERFFARDDMAICTDGLMPGPGQQPHPRLLGSFPRALRMAREQLIPLEKIIYRMSVMPMRFLALEDPTLRAGADASLVLLDWEAVTDRNSFDDPLVDNHGIDSVWVHGARVSADGQMLPNRPRNGRILL
ncbi:MAG: N-acyl-D-amino-acid deacylase, partial [Myxococcota bacterium]